MARRYDSVSFGGWKTVIMAAGFAILAPYVIRRMTALFSRGGTDVSANDVLVAGRDSVRDAADDMNVGGVKGKLSRGVDRAVDHLSK